jgi:hypothetical protein
LQADVLTAILNSMPPEELGKLVAQFTNPTEYIPNKLFDQRGVGYRGNLPIQLSQLRPGMGTNPIATGNEGGSV